MKYFLLIYLTNKSLHVSSRLAAHHQEDLPFSVQRHYSPGWASVSFKSFLHPSRFRATTVQFLHPSLAASSFTPSSQRSLGLPLGRFPPGPLRRTLLDKSSSSWRMTCPAHLNLLSLQNFTMSFSPHKTHQEDQLYINSNLYSHALYCWTQSMTIPVAVYIEVILLMMSSKPARNM